MAKKRAKPEPPKTTHAARAAKLDNVDDLEELWRERANEDPEIRRVLVRQAQRELRGDSNSHPRMPGSPGRAGVKRSR